MELNNEIIQDLIDKISKENDDIQMDIICLIYLIGIKQGLTFKIPEGILKGRNIVRFNKEIEEMFQRAFSLMEIFELYNGKEIKIPSQSKFEKHISLYYHADKNILRVKHKFRISGLLKSYLAVIFK